MRLPAPETLKKRDERIADCLTQALIELELPGHILAQFTRCNELARHAGTPLSGRNERQLPFGTHAIEKIRIVWGNPKLEG